TVRLRRDGHGARLLVEDDGVGPGGDPAAPSDSTDAPQGTPSGSTHPPQGTPSGFGLSGLRDRVRLVGGEVRFGAREGGGSCLEVHVPLNRAAARTVPEHEGNPA
ncbi:MAG: hypothetical protein J0H64_10345, partial [Actinobacteria bacterium]|nr:hypothetical protein [Actinomycetota bacterium]